MREEAEEPADAQLQRVVSYAVQTLNLKVQDLTSLVHGRPPMVYPIHLIEFTPPILNEMITTLITCRRENVLIVRKMKTIHCGWVPLRVFTRFWL